MAVGKKELVENLAKRLEISKAQADRMVDGMVGEITETLQAGDGVNLPGFGKFEVREQQARQGRNPRTGEPVQIAAKKVPKFTPGKSLKESVR